MKVYVVASVISEEYEEGEKDLYPQVHRVCKTMDGAKYFMQLAAQPFLNQLVEGHYEISEAEDSIEIVSSLPKFYVHIIIFEEVVMKC